MFNLFWVTISYTLAYSFCDTMIVPLFGDYITFTFMHLADAFIQSDLQLHSGYTFLISMCVPWELNPTFCATDAMLYHWATQEHITWSKQGPSDSWKHICTFFPLNGTHKYHKVQLWPIEGTTSPFVP